MQLVSEKRWKRAAIWGAWLPALSCVLAAASSLVCTFSPLRMNVGTYERVLPHGLLFAIDTSTGYGRVVRTIPPLSLSPVPRATPEDPAPSWSLVVRQPFVTENRLVCWEQLTGWPIPSVRCYASMLDEGVEPELSLHEGLVASEARGVRAVYRGALQAYGFRPIMPLFMLNSGAWGLLLLGTAGVARAWSAVKSAMRGRAIRQGRCPTCAYSLRGLASTTCPECGEVCER